MADVALGLRVRKQSVGSFYPVIQRHPKLVFLRLWNKDTKMKKRTLALACPTNHPLGFLPGISLGLLTPRPSYQVKMQGFPLPIYGEGKEGLPPNTPLPSFSPKGSWRKGWASVSVVLALSNKPNPRKTLLCLKTPAFL